MNNRVTFRQVTVVLIIVVVLLLIAGFVGLVPQDGVFYAMAGGLTLASVFSYLLS